MAVQLDACIQCNLCVRACREVQVNDVIGMAARGHHEKIVFDFDDPMGNSTCVACGECVQACPTGALMPATLVDANGVYANAPDREVDSVCPYCGVGCQLTYQIKDDRIVAVEGKDGPANHNRLCVKGRFGFDYVHHPDRLTEPLIRKDGVSKHDTDIDPANPYTHFRKASWDEALDRAAAGLARIRDRDGKRALAGFGSAKGSNEEAYLFQKLVRTGFGSNNVDHCTRLCHASSVAALMEGIGSGAVTAPFTAAQDADVIIVIGARPTENHPVAATFFKQAAKRGAKVFVMDPRGQTLVRHATRTLRFSPGRDVAMLNALLHTIIEEGLTDRQYIQAHTEDYEKLREHIRDYSPEKMAPICGIDAATLRDVARTYARAERGDHLLGHGHLAAHPRHRQRALPDRAGDGHRAGRPARHRAASAARPEQRPGRLGCRADPDGLSRLPVGRETRDPGEIRDAVADPARRQARADRGRDHGRGASRRDQGHVHHGREPGDVGPRRAARPRGAGPSRTSRGAGHLPDRDREIRRCRVAGLGLAGEGRHRLQHQPPGADGPRGIAAARQCAARIWWIIQEIARRIGLDWSYTDPRDVFAEMKLAMPSLDNITWERLEREGSVTYPCDAADKPGNEIVFGDGFPTASGRAKLVPAAIIPPAEEPDAEYPMVLTTGRQLEHWHTGAMTRRASVLDEIEPEAVASLAPAELRRLGIAAGEPVRVTTRRGTIELKARADSDVAPGMVFIPFCYAEAAANILTNPQLDPFGKIPEFKFCAAKVEPAEVREAAE